MQHIASIIIWIAVGLLVIFWLPLLAVVRLLDRDSARYKTGRMFRRLGLLISRVNPNWKISIEGDTKIDDRHPYIIVSNHMSNADIPVISNLPWEMKWVAKKELFEIPIVGWMMKLAGDIPVSRGSKKQALMVFKRCKYYLDRNTSVMFFPEGTRSRTGNLTRFASGAFDLAIREKKPILPLVLDGTQGCLPKKSWVFEKDVHVKLKILDPIPTDDYEKGDSTLLMQAVRDQMAEQLAEWRGVDVTAVDYAADRRQRDGGDVSEG
ncbi:lysophospholipid acyltransferase family protein [Rhodohalobacter sulfatireducens]|uniref:1-acyl-sn-glycerol-3-phosphate acyltransferase n=1 Tax=Rhodohalobacter sulfatireducens TaxID=2911366 RepID=A0ABS9KDX3_9BACT|nr:lysophospholipid acyltransferase family protein [Rhodohalobacter sulfatireducens]MCG2589064.1 1-acyl-sn-glycerol-3-phosphate acyltransferase [Rhodohalobacter sulfatireducens]